MARVVFTPRAGRQLCRLHTYIAERSGDDRADDYIGRIVSSCRNLATFPYRGTRRDDVLPGLRTIGFERRVTIAFRVTEDLVLIQGIFYGGQDFEKSLKT